MYNMLGRRKAPPMLNTPLLIRWDEIFITANLSCCNVASENIAVSFESVHNVIIYFLYCFFSIVLGLLQDRPASMDNLGVTQAIFRYLARE